MSSEPQAQLALRREANTIYILALALLVAANVLTLVPSGSYGRLIGSAVMFCFLPGALMMGLVLPSAASESKARAWIELALLGSAMSYLMTTMVTLLLSYLPLPLSYPVLLSVLDVTVLILLYLNYRTGSAGRLALARGAWPRLTIPLVILALIILLAVLLRLGNLGYSEYLGDETDVVYRARQVILGNLGELFLQRKGPVQVMMTAAFALGTNSFDELALRFPFAWASVLSVLAAYLLGRTAWSQRIGLLAAALLTIDGIVLGFSRLVQYQGVVLLTLTLILYCGYRSSAIDNTPTVPGARFARSRRYFSIALILFALALLTHYETALIALPLVMVGWPVLRKYFSKENRAEGLVTAALFAALLLVFYIPFVLHPHFGTTSEVYTYRRIGYGEGPFNNIERYAESSIFYNSIYYVVATAVLWLLGAVSILRQAVPSRWQGLVYGAAALLALGVLVSLIAPSSLVIEDRSLAFLFFVPLLALAIFPFSNERIGQAVLVWLILSLVAYAFFIKVPGLHYYTMSPAAALVAAIGLDRLFPPVSEKRAAREIVGWAVVALFFIVMAGYPFLVFVRNEPPYALEFPQHRSALYWTPQNDIPEGGFFGFSHKSGWKVLSALYQKGDLQGAYLSNKKQVKPEWTYMRDPVKVDQNPRYFFYDEFSARFTNKPKYSLDWARQNFRQVGQVRVNGEPRILIFDRLAAEDDPSGTPDGGVTSYDAEKYDPVYDQVDWLAEYRQATDHNLDANSVRLLGKYLEDQRQPESLVIVNDPVLQKALNYYYAGSSVTLPVPWSDAGLSAQVGSRPQVTLVIWSGINEQDTAKAAQELANQYKQSDESASGNLKVITFRRL